MRRVWFASIVGVLALYVGAGAVPQAQGGRQGGDAQNPPRGQRAASIADRTAGMQKLDGFFPMYWDEPAGTLYLEIPKLNTEVLYQTGIGAGMGSNDIGLDRGLLVGTRVVSFERVGPKVLMVQPNYDYRAVSDNADERKAVEDAFAKSVIWGFTVAAESDGRALVDLSDFLMRDATGLGARLQPAAYRFDRTRSAVYLPNTKAFPKNTEIEVTTTLVTDGGGGRGGQGPGQIGGRIGDVVPSTEAMTVRQHHSFIELPDANFKMRKFDARAGYFGVNYVDFSQPFGNDVRQRFISRHRLEKRDPNAAVSEPVKPIVYYVDRGAPEPIRSALLEGAGWWSQAFDAAGFRNGFRVELMPEGADPMDVRYNVINWVHRSTRGWSYGASIADPRTGEIMQGHVSLGSLRAQQDYLIFEGLLSPYTTGTERPQQITAAVVGRLKQLAAHETGHTLGLSHNYYDSAMGRISVMDYPHPLVGLKADGTMDLADAYAVGIGEWDKVAIRYGYGVFPAATEAAELKRVLDTAWDKDLRFLTNQDTDVNPKVDQWNNGTDVAAELKRIMNIRRAGMERFGETAIQKDWPMAMIEDVLVPLYLHHRYAVEAAASAIGGQDYIYAMRGDGRQPVAWVSAAAQKAALDALMETLKPSELALSRAVLSKIPPRPDGYDRTRELFPRNTGGAFDPLSPAVVASDLTVGFILTNARAARMVSQHAVDATLPGLDDVIDRIVATTFDGVTNSSYTSEIKRSVEQVVVNRLIDLAETAPMSQVRAIAMQKLKAIQARASRPALAGADLATLQLIASDVDRFLKRPAEPARRVTPPGTPPGAPIGEPPFSYLRGEEDCIWVR
jgi:Met-zincin/Domain of unknown function (DUF5117)